MNRKRNLTYVISDLHLGGAAGLDGQRGFQICTQTAALAEFIDSLANGDNVELVIAGDFVDFLAEADETGQPATKHWTALRDNEDQAAALLLTIATRCPEVFSALRRLVQNGHTLTVLLGNHDIELVYPKVRKTLQALLGVPVNQGLRFVYDGEAYVVGDALIEHGNRYDGWNCINHDALRRVCSMLSRGQKIPDAQRFLPPPGSRLVAEIMNPVKHDYPFIDLLKPESTAAVPLLLALEPGARSLIASLAKLALSASEHRVGKNALPTRSGDISATMRAPFPAAETNFYDEEAALQEVLGQALGTADADGFLQQMHKKTEKPRPDGLPVVRRVDLGDIAAKKQPNDGKTSKWSGGVSWLKLLLSSDTDTEPRLTALRNALRAFCDPALFALNKSPPGDPLYAAAQELGRTGRFRYVVMGHTHLARDLPLTDEGRYLNSGTWADLMRVPEQVFSPEPIVAEQATRRLVQDIEEGRYAQLIERRPSFVRLECEDEKVVSASVEFFQSGTKL